MPCSLSPLCLNLSASTCPWIYIAYSFDSIKGLKAKFYTALAASKETA